MGSTHYFEGLTATSAVISDAKKIIDATTVTICGPGGQGLPWMDEKEGIWLNGFEAADEDYETFFLRGTDEPEHPELRAFCKTEHRPYDVVVTAILISAAAHAGGDVRSDGQWSNWSAGVALFEKAVRPLTADEKLALELDVEAMRPTAKATVGCA